MSESPTAGFGKYVPGFDFLQNLAKGASQGLPQMPPLAQWVAPSLSVEELEKRISELKAVRFWLEQNSRALEATIQALEVQKLTLATLQGMNVQIGDMAKAFQFPAPDAAAAATRERADKATAPSAPREPEATAAPEIADQDPEPAQGKRGSRGSPASKSGGTPAASAVDPLQLWGALTQQFQNIAATALQDVARSTAPDAGKSLAGATGGAARRTPAKTTAATRAGKTARVTPRSRKRAAP